MGSRIKARVQSANIFINYRREDSAGHAGRLFDALSGHFEGRLFMDVDNLDPGTDFIEAIEEAVGSCEALIVVIGRDWLNIADDKTGRRRLDDPADFVRLEVESALARKVRVIPVLVQDAAMPSAAELPPSIAALARRHAIELSDDRWAYDVDRLTRTIQVIMEEKRDLATRVETPDKLTTPPTPIARAAAPKVDEARVKGARPWLLSLGALAWVAVVVLASVAWIRHTPRGNDAPVASQPPPAGGVVIAAPVPSLVTPVGGEPAAMPASDVDDGNRMPTPTVVPLAVPAAITVVVEPAAAVEPVRRVESPAANRVEAELFVPTVRVTPVPTPTVKAEETTIPFADEAPAPTAATDSPVTSAPVPSSRPARVTIVSPRNGEVVGSDVMVRGVVVALVDGQAFLGIRQRNGSIYPRGEIFPDADGQWSIMLRSSKEKSFEILVVTSTSKEATQVLRDQRSRDDGLAVLPDGASVSSSIVSLKRQRRIVGILNPKDAEGDR
jgi:hypothetical protein